MILSKGQGLVADSVPEKACSNPHSCQAHQLGANHHEFLTFAVLADVSGSNQEEGAIQGTDPAQVPPPPMQVGWLAAQRAPHCCCITKVVEVRLGSPYNQLAIQAIELLRLEVVEALFERIKCCCCCCGIGEPVDEAGVLVGI